MKFLSTLSLRQPKGAARFIFFFLASSLGITLVSAFNAHEFDLARLCYVIFFLNISMAPAFFISRASGRYLLITIFLPIYFILFCIGDLVSVLGIEAKATPETPEIQSAVDQIIIFGGLAYILGYIATANIGKRQWLGWFSREWDLKKIKFAAISCWLLGTWAFITIFFFSKTSSLPLSIVSNLKHFAQLGSLMLIYLYLTKKEKSTLILLCCIAVFNLMLGFAANTKEISFLVPILYLILSFVSSGKVNKLFLSALITVMIVYTFFFGAYRLWVIQVKNQTPIEALQNFSESMATVIQNAGKKDPDNSNDVSFLKERIETRKYLVFLVDGIENKGVPTMDGYTLGLFFDSFVPRVFWPEKPEISIGRLFNKEFQISASPLTYIPATHIGEFYWNYKMPGVLIGMTLVGALMAFFSKMSDLSKLVTLPRMLVLLMTIYILCVRFEADWAQQYSNVVRTLASIWVLDLILRKRKRARKIYRPNMTISEGSPG